MAEQLQTQGSIKTDHKPRVYNVPTSTYEIKIDGQATESRKQKANFVAFRGSQLPF